MKKIKPDHVPTFHLSTKVDGSKRYRTLHVAYRKRTKTATQLRASTADDIRGRIKDAIHFGIDCHFLPLALSDGAVRLCWLEYRDDDGHWIACQPDIDAGDQYTLMRKGMELLQKMGDTIERKRGRPNRGLTDSTFENPGLVVQALRDSRKFIEIERFEVDRVGYWIETVYERTRTVEVA